MAHNQLHVDQTTIRDPSLGPYIAASTIGKLTGSECDDADEVLSTDTAEALREAARKRADTYDEEDPQSGKAPVAPLGLLAIHLLDMKNFDHTAIADDLVDPNLRFKLLISIGDIYKETGLKKGTRKHVHEKDKLTNVFTGVAVDEIKHFLLTVPQQLSDPKNILRIELYTALINADPAAEAQLIGVVEVHLHELIQAMMVIDMVPLALNGRQVANLYLEFAFMYGALGFHYSTQLENPGFNPNRDLARTMFPRVALPERRDGEVLLAVPQHPPGFIPWTCPAVAHWDEAARRSPPDPPPIPPAAFGNRVMRETQRILADYLPLRSRGERLTFLKKLVRGSPGVGQSADVVGASGEQDKPPSGPADHRRPGADRSGGNPGHGRDGPPPTRTAAQPQQTAQLRQSSGSSTPHMPTLVPPPPPAAAADSGQPSAGWSSPHDSPRRGGGGSSSSSSTGQQQKTSGQSPPTVTEQPARGPQRSASSTVRIAAPKQIRRAPLRRPPGDGTPAAAAKTEDAGRDDRNTADTSVHME